MAVARRKAIEKQEQIKKMISKRGQAGVFVRSNKGDLFFLASKDIRRTKISAREGRAIEKMMSHPVSGRQSAKGSSSCGKTLQWLLTHSPKSANWRRVSVWWMKNC